MNILRKAFKIFNGSSWDEYHLKTDSKQVIHTKADGTDTTVEEQLLALNSTLLKKVEWTSEKMSFDVSQARNLDGLYKPTVEGYTALACLGGQGNGAASMICNPNGWVYNASGLKYSSVSVTYQWLFIKNL